MIPLETLLGQVSHAVQTAGGAVRQAECGQFLNWFETGEDGGLSPKAASFRLSGDQGAVNVPLVSLVNHNALGLTGGAGSAARRAALLKRLDLPERMTANALLEAVNLLYTREEFLKEAGYDESGADRAPL